VALTVRRIRRFLPPQTFGTHAFAEGILIGFFMVKMMRAAQSTINQRCRSLVARPKLAFVFGFLATATTVLAALSWFHSNQVDEGHSAQVTLNQIAVLTREINNLTLTALQEQHLTLEAETEMRAARHSLPNAVLAARLHVYHTSALEKVWPVLDDTCPDQSAMGPDANW
jgi:hypothetical protein